MSIFPPFSLFVGNKITVPSGAFRGFYSFPKKNKPGKEKKENSILWGRGKKANSIACLLFLLLWWWQVAYFFSRTTSVWHLSPGTWQVPDRCQHILCEEKKVYKHANESELILPISFFAFLFLEMPFRKSPPPHSSSSSSGYVRMGGKIPSRKWGNSGRKCGKASVGLAEK